jgi:N-acetylglucosamine-6-sulfatase
MATNANHFKLLAILATVVLTVVVTAGLAVLVRAQKESASQAKAPPNIVFIKTDDQPESTLANMPYLKNLIKAQGRTFNNAFNAFPLCCPSRATMQRGQYAHNTGVFSNNADRSGAYQTFDQLDREQSTVATWMDAAGYRTVHVGRYMNGFDPALLLPPPPGWDAFNRGLKRLV